MIFDFHIHFSFKPANSKSYQILGNGEMPDPNHMTERFKAEPEYYDLANLDNTSIKSSQANGDALMEGGLRVICNTLYPLERGFIKESIAGIISMLTGFSKQRLLQLHRNQISYFQLLEIEFRNLLQNQNKISHSKHGFTYKLVNSFSEIENGLAANENCIYVINSIEGAHAFADDFFSRQGRFINIKAEERKFILSTKPRSGESVFEKFIDSHIGNIDFIKTNWSQVPFFVTFAHHYYNHLCGFAQSLGPGIDLAVNQGGGTVKADGSAINYFHLGIHRWGYKIIAHLLKRKSSDNKKVRRILIDVKHMSVQSRLDYYMNVVRLQRNQYNDNIPIIKSHTAVSGRRSMSRSIANDLELFDDELDNSKYFYPGAINLFDDEIIEIIQSDGLIGIMIDERRIMGKILPPEANLDYSEFCEIVKSSQKNISKYFKYKHQYKWGKITESEFRVIEAEYLSKRNLFNQKLLPAYFSVILRQLFYIVDIAGEAGWNYICLGTDYDGVINPLDLYVRAGDMKSLKADIVNFWTEMITHSDVEIQFEYSKFLFGKNPEYYIEKFLFQNGMDFLKKYYNDDYLLHGTISAMPIV